MTHDAMRERGFSVIELLIVIAIILILAAIEIPNLLRARIAANQAAATASLMAIEAAEVTYSVTYSHGYTSSLSQLGPSAGAASSNGADLIDTLLASGEKGGYSFVYAPGPVVDGKIDTYTLTAVPSMPCSSGVNYYTLDPSNQATIFSKNFQASSEKDIIAQVLVGSLGSAQMTCDQGGP